MLAFMIVAHSQPQLLQRLVSRLMSPVAATFVHLDAKCDSAGFEWLEREGVHLASRRISVNWSGWSHVRASVAMLRQALADPRPFTRFALLSGVDYPLARPEAMLEFLDAVDMEAVDCLRMPNFRHDKPYSRIGVRWLEGGERTAGVTAKFVRRINRQLARLTQRDVVGGFAPLVPHAGSTWWVLSRQGAQNAIEAIDAGGPAVRMLKTSFCPDEHFYASVIAATIPGERIGCSVTFTDWSKRDIRPVPAVLDDGHILALTGDGPPPGGRTWLFARKVDPLRMDLLDLFDDYADRRLLDPVTQRPLDYEAFNRKYADR